MPLDNILIANRGEIAVRIARAASELDLRTVAVYAEDDASSQHVRAATESRKLPKSGPAAYLDVGDIVRAAVETGCNAIHPGYGFLSESAELARRATEAGLTFIGPQAEHLDLFGDKVRTRALARECGVAVMEGTDQPVSLDAARAFLASLGPGSAMMIKARAGGGGRGMRIVRSGDEIDLAYERCRSEAMAAFGDGALYVERFLPRARHIEIQIVADGQTAVHLGERECTIQRRNQKLIETAPSAALPQATREALCAAALKLATSVRYLGLGTFEFLVDASKPQNFAFIEANPRLQVEHTVTEEVYGLDLVKTQIRLARGARLPDLGLDSAPPPRGHAVQFRINMETIGPDGTTKPTGGVLQAFDLPSGPGIRVDTFGYVGYRTTSQYDSLLAKLIVHSPEGEVDALRRARRALREFRIGGLQTNIPLLQTVLDDKDFLAHRIDTMFLEQRLPGWAGRLNEARAAEQDDPLKPLDLEGSSASNGAKQKLDLPEGMEAIVAPLQGRVIALDVAPGDRIRAGQQLCVLEAMKMEHVVSAPKSGVLHTVYIQNGDTVYEDALLAALKPDGNESADAAVETQAQVDLDHIRADLAETLARQAELRDENRPEAVARRHKTNHRTARENIADFCDEGSFIEYGGLALASQRRRRTVEELRRISPADGLITGIGAVNGAQCEEEKARCAVMAYDYTVLAGTQGMNSHRKTDRLLALADKWQLPLMLFAEGGGGRPGEEWPTPAALEITTFSSFSALNGKVPLLGMVTGRCFAGNASLLGCCDVIIAAADANIGMGGPAIVEGGGLGVFRAEDIGPMSVQVPNGVVDVAVADEAEGVQVAKQYLSYFQGRRADWTCEDQRWLRHAVPENRMRAYDIRALVRGLADTGSVLELRSGFGLGMITAFIRIEGRPLGLIANYTRYLGGAIDADGADKASRFIQLCDAFDIPIVSLCDTPGIMVGPETEKKAHVRHVSRMFVNAGNARVPFFTIVLRKAYGLGALAMAAGSIRASFFVVSWPSGEFGPMGIEGAIKLAYRNELNAIEDPAARKAWFEGKVAKSYEELKALSIASYFDIDNVIDPVDTRKWIVRGLKSLPSAGKWPARPARIDTW